MGQLGTSQLGTTTLGGTLPESDSDDAVQTVIDILSKYSNWSLPAPEIYEHQEVAQKSKENNPDPAVYVWSPVDGSLEQFSADNDVLNEFRTVEAQVWTLNSQNAETYHQEIIDLLQRYADDNYQNTNFHYIQPQSATDNRSEHITRMTDHFILSVQVELHNHRD